MLFFSRLKKEDSDSPVDQKVEEFLKRVGEVNKQIKSNFVSKNSFSEVYE